MNLDRELQKEILEYLIAKYADDSAEHVQNLEKKFGPTTPIQLLYLHEHGLISGKVEQVLENPNEADPVFWKSHRSVNKVRLTARGYDFLTDDGGLSAILNVVTIRIDQEQFKKMLAKNIDQSELPPEKKNALKHLIKNTQQEGMSKLTTEIVNYAFNHAPDLLTYLRTFCENQLS